MDLGAGAPGVLYDVVSFVHPWLRSQQVGRNLNLNNLATITNYK